MVSKEILKEKNMMLPVEYEQGSCENAINVRLSGYEDLLRKYSVDDMIICSVKKFREHLNKMYEEYYLGHQNKAYCEFKKAFQGQISDMGVIMTGLPKEPLYRARKNIGYKDYKNDEMFHIKYGLRGKVQTQRFSFPGLPCLYLGGSAYVCWLELNRPPFDQFQVAAIWQKDESKNFKVIDLCIHPLTYYQNLIELEQDGDTKSLSCDIKQYLRWWPIMAACSIAVKNEEDFFKPEYIFPQFMLQYFLEEDISQECIGIKYISIKAGKISKKQYESDYRTYTNYVIPIRTSDANAKGFCNFLAKKFGVVRNYSGKELVVLTDSIRKSGIEWQEIGSEEKKHPLEETKLYGTNDISYLYSKSIFRRIEVILENRDMDKYANSGELIISPISKEDIEHLFDN